MGVRLATAQDITQAIEVGKRILARSVYGADVFENQSRRMMLRAINDKSMALWVAEHKGNIVGFFLAIREQHWFSKKKYAADMCFVMDDKHGNYAPPIIRRFVKWAKSDPNVVDIQLSISSGLDNDGRTGRMYQNLGFTLVGGVYALLEASQCQA